MSDTPTSFHRSQATTRAVLTGAVRDFWRALPDLFLFDILFQVIAFVLLTPLVAWLFRQFVKTSGSEAVANFDIARFLLSPFGLAMSAVIVVLLCAISFGRFAGLMYIGQGVAEDRRLTCFNALKFITMGRIPRILKACFLMLFVLLAAALPFLLAALVVAKSLLSEHDINYYLDNQPPAFITAVGIGAALLVMGAVVLVFVSTPLIFVLPHAMFQDASIRTGFRESRNLAKGGFRQIATAILVWLFAGVITSSAANAGIYIVGKALVRAAGESVRLLLVVLGGLTATSIVINLLIALTSVSIGCLIIVHLYRQACGRTGLEIPNLGEQAPAMEAQRQWSIPKMAPLATAIIAVGLSVLVAHQVFENVRMDDHVEISAHRGASLAAPENTLGAVKRAITDGATHVEIDVQRTADGVIVLNHDADLMRMGGSPLVISQTNFEDLRAVDVGSGFGPEFAGEPIPSLEEVIQASMGKVKLIVELKSYQADASLLVEDVVRILKDHDLLSDALVMSLKYSEMQKVKRLAPEITTGFLASAALGDIAKLDIDFLAVNKKLATDALIGAAHAQGKVVFVWTVDDPNEMYTMIDRGVDNIITNDPATAVRVLKERANLSNAERILLRFKSLYVQ